MEKVDWKVGGMTCTNCALTISKYLQHEGMESVKVNPIDGAVSFTNPDKNLDKLKAGIHNLGYSVVSPDHAGHHHEREGRFLGTNKKRFFFCLPFTLVLMMHMLHPWIHLPWLMNPWVQMVLCLPVFIVGMDFFGRSGWKSILNGTPNMNVLIALGALAAFAYSTAGAIMNWGENFLFFETAAEIITIVFFGNYIEEISIQSTQRAIKSLAKSQKVMANMIAFDDAHREQIMPVENTQLRTGDLVLIKNGETVPMDAKILWGECQVNEAIITGESIPVYKTKKDVLIGGSILESGLVKAQVTEVGDKTVLSGILKMVQDAQGEKPPVQKMADRISEVFVPSVIGIAIITLLANYFIGGVTFGDSFIRSIAVLVIACPCAMGLATPAAIAVGLGRGAKTGILYRNASILESFKDIKQVVFDKTGTLTTGNFKISKFYTTLPEEEFKLIMFSLEKYSNHPIGKSIVREWPQKQPVQWKSIGETRGLGIAATDKDGNSYNAGSDALIKETDAAPGHHVYLLKNQKVVGWLDLQDEVRPEAEQVIKWMKLKGIKTFLLSGDHQDRAEKIGSLLGIEQIEGNQTPTHKLERIEALTKSAPTAMIGDGINDAPALAKATIGISLSDASQIAMQSADVILVGNGMQHLPTALGLGKHTFETIKQNLFWAFFYNIFAIPIAAFGLLTPAFAALAMGFSDVVLIFNSARLFIKKVL